jgi:hypothetical protein
MLLSQGKRINGFLIIPCDSCLTLNREIVMEIMARWKMRLIFCLSPYCTGGLLCFWAVVSLLRVHPTLWLQGGGLGQNCSTEQRPWPSPETRDTHTSSLAILLWHAGSLANTWGVLQPARVWKWGRETWPIIVLPSHSRLALSAVLLQLSWEFQRPSNHCVSEKLVLPPSLPYFTVFFILPS